MATPYDSTTRHLFKQDPEAWLKLLNIETDAVEEINVDMSSIAGTADMVLLIGSGKNREAINVELQSSYDAVLEQRLLFYSVIISKNRSVPVRSFIVLLRPEADGPEMTGILRKQHSGNTTYLEFRYEVVRLWQLKAETIFQGGLSVLPLAFVSDAKPEELPALVRRTEARLKPEGDSGKARDTWAAIEILLGLRYERDFVIDLLQYVRTLKESTTYQGIIEEGKAMGKAEGERAVLLRMGTKRFGAPDEATLAALNGIESIERLEDMSDRILSVNNWGELLAV